jgi:L-alanine-DL-glutamate epimerase-like enolase superfamily enzyme
MYTPPQLTQVEMAASEFLLGRDPLAREGLWQDLWVRFRHTDHFGLGPIDVALWDLAGKDYGAPVSELLGGYRERIPAYASTYWGDTEGGLTTPEDYADFAADCADRGYPAFKIHPHGDPDLDIEICEAVAERVGNEMQLMLDPASEYTTFGETLRVGWALDRADFFWYEDPMAETGQSIEMNRRLARDLKTPILGAEHVRGGPFGSANHLAGEALDFVRADAHQDGGITSVMKIAHLAEAFGLDVELHVGGPAHLHCLSAIRNTNYFEHGLLHPEVGWMADQGFRTDVESLNDDGTVSVPEGPGLGVEIDWGFVEARETDRTVVDEASTAGLS